MSDKKKAKALVETAMCEIGSGVFNGSDKDLVNYCLHQIGESIVTHPDDYKRLGDESDGEFGDIVIFDNDQLAILISVRRHVENKRLDAVKVISTAYGTGKVEQTDYYLDHVTQFRSIA